MDKIKAKFKCNEVTSTEHYDGTKRLLYSAKLQAVSNGSEENKKFFAATPSGSITLGSFLPALFVPGKEYYVEFTPVEPE